MKYEALVKSILKNIGGKENVAGVTHCITRLRFKLKDEKVVETDIIKKIPGVITVIQSGGQYQIVIGNHVPEVYKEFVEYAGIAQESTEVVKGTGNVFDRFIDILSGTFQPILGVLCATGMIKGLATLLVACQLISLTSGTYTVLWAIADGLFYFFPIFLGATAAKKFGLSQFIGMAIGAAFVYPSIVGLSPFGNPNQPLMEVFTGTILQTKVYLEFMKIPVILPDAGYTSSVIPIILTVAVAAPIERCLRKVIPSVVRTFIVPFFTLLISVPLAFLIIGPIASWISALLGFIFMWLYNFSPAVLGLVLGGVWQVLVIFGLHWSVIPLVLNNIGTLGSDPLIIATFGCSFAQIGTVAAIMYKTKNKDLKGICFSAFISGIFGVTEPAIYGVTLPRKKVFLMSCVAGAFSGMLFGIFKVRSFIVGGLGVFGYPNVVNPKGSENFMVLTIVLTLVAFVVGFVLSCIVYKDEESVEVAVTEPKETQQIKREMLSKRAVIVSPIKGNVIPLKDVKDEAFSSEAIGKGVAIIPVEGKIVAPFDGVVTALFETKHAIGLTSDEGIEMMIHVGMDTVQLGGKHFRVFIKQGDAVKKGQILEEVDIQAIQKEGYSIETPVIVTNYFDYVDVIPTEKSVVNIGDELIYVVYEEGKKEGE